MKLQKCEKSAARELRAFEKTEFRRSQRCDGAGYTIAAVGVCVLCCFGVSRGTFRQQVAALDLQQVGLSQLEMVQTHRTTQTQDRYTRLTMTMALHPFICIAAPTSLCLHHITSPLPVSITIGPRYGTACSTVL